MSRNALALWTSSTAFLAGAAVLALLMHLGSVDGVAFIALLLVPLILFALVSGRLEEFSAPGGWGAKFRVEIASKVGPSGILSDVQKVQFVEKQSLKSLGSADASLNPKQPNALVLKVGTPDYSPGDIQQYLKTLKAVGTATYVVFVYKESGRFIGSASADQVLAILDSSLAVKEFMNALGSTGQEPFGQFDFLTTEALGPTDTNKTALDKFLASGANGLVVLGNSQEPVGVVDRTRLLTKLLANLAATDPP